MAVKTKAQIVQSLVELVRSVFPSSDVDEGSSLRDISIEANAREYESAYLEINTTQQQTAFVENADQISEDDMDKIAKNYGITRKAATFATGEYVFRKRTQPTGTVQIGLTDGTGQVVVTTRSLQDGSIVQFLTTETVYMTPATVLNPETGYYEVTAAIRAVSAGAVGNVSAANITVIPNSVSGVDSGINIIPTSGGFDQESNVDLAARIVSAQVGVNKFNKAGYVSRAKDVAGVQAALAISPNDSDSVRGPGTVDVYVLGEDLATKEDTFVYETGTLLYGFEKTPVFEVLTLQAIVLGVLTTLTLDVDYSLEKDETSGAAGSATAQDKIRFLDLGTKPDDGTEVVMLYSYNKLVEDVQAHFDSPEEEILTVSVMVKQTQKVIVDISLRVQILAGSDRTAVTNKIIDSLSALFNAQGLGATISQSDVNFQLRTDVTEIDNIFSPFENFSKRGDVDSDVITMAAKEYPRIDSLSVTVEYA